MKTTFLNTARLKSTRLPKKIMLEVGGKPLIVHMLDRIKHAKTIDKIIICTSTNPQDDPLEEIAAKEKVNCHRGSEEDVLARLLEASKNHNLSHFANITADCPMIDPESIDQIVLEYHNSEVDLIKFDNSDDDVPFDCFVVQVDALDKICRQKKANNTEVWLKYFTSDPEITVREIVVENIYRHPVLKTSLDYPEDFSFIKRIFRELYKKDKVFSILDIIRLVKISPEILEINASDELMRRWKNHVLNINSN